MGRPQSNSLVTPRPNLGRDSRQNFAHLRNQSLTSHPSPSITPKPSRPSLPAPPELLARLSPPPSPSALQRAPRSSLSHSPLSRYPLVIAEDDLETTSQPPAETSHHILPEQHACPVDQVSPARPFSSSSFDSAASPATPDDFQPRIHTDLLSCSSRLHDSYCAQDTIDPHEQCRPFEYQDGDVIHALTSDSPRPSTSRALHLHHSLDSIPSQASGSVTSSDRPNSSRLPCQSGYSFSHRYSHHATPSSSANTSVGTRTSLLSNLSAKDSISRLPATDFTRSPPIRPRRPIPVMAPTPPGAKIVTSVRQRSVSVTTASTRQRSTSITAGNIGQPERLVPFDMDHLSLKGSDRDSTHPRNRAKSDAYRRDFQLFQDEDIPPVPPILGLHDLNSELVVPNEAGCSHHSTQPPSPSRFKFQPVNTSPPCSSQTKHSNKRIGYTRRMSLAKGFFNPVRETKLIWRPHKPGVDSGCKESDGKSCQNMELKSTFED